MASRVRSPFLLVLVLELLVGAWIWFSNTPASAQPSTGTGSAAIATPSSPAPAPAPATSAQLPDDMMRVAGQLGFPICAKKPPPPSKPPVVTKSPPVWPLFAGFLLVVVGVPIRVTIGSSLAITAVAATAGVIGKAVTEQIPLPPAVMVAAGALPGAQLGAASSRRLSGVALRRALLAVIVATGARVWWNLLAH